MLLAVLLGLGLRLATPASAESDARGWRPAPRVCWRWWQWALVLICPALGRKDVAYPTSCPGENSAGSRCTRHRIRPTPSHSIMASLSGGAMSHQALMLSSAAVWLDRPTDKRDAYASMLARQTFTAGAVEVRFRSSIRPRRSSFLSAARAGAMACAGHSGRGRKGFKRGGGGQFAAPSMVSASSIQSQPSAQGSRAMPTPPRAGTH